VRFPAWLKIQRISLFLYLASAVLLVIYALGFISDVYIFFAYGNRSLAGFYHEMQEINSGLLWKALLLIIFAVILFLLQLGRHPAGLYTLIIVALFLAAGLFLSAHSLAVLAEARRNYAALDLSSLNRYIERGAIKYRYSTLVFDLGLAGYILFMGSSLFMAASVIRNAFSVREMP